MMAQLWKFQPKEIQLMPKADIKLPDIPEQLHQSRSSADTSGHPINKCKTFKTILDTFA